MHSQATRWGKCSLIGGEKGKGKRLWYPEKPPPCWDLGLESREGLGALEFQCFLRVSSNHEQYSKNIICLKFIFESCLIQMMHARNQFHTYHPLKYILYNRYRYTHAHLNLCVTWNEFILLKFQKRSSSKPIPSLTDQQKDITLLF